MTRAATPEGDGSRSFPARPSTLDPLAEYHRKRVHRTAITRADVANAIALVPRVHRTGLGMPYGAQQTHQSARRFEQERWYLSVSPGTVKVHSRTMAPRVRLGQDDVVEDGRAGKPIAGWSTKSRSNMFSVLPSLDYSPMFETGDRAAMVTLTLPGDGWEKLVPDLASFKKMLNRFQREYARAWGAMPVAVWKMEFQHRGAPHVHLFMCIPSGHARGRGAKRRFSEWASITWAKIVGAPAGSVARMNHEFRGVWVDEREGQRFSDPRRIAAYFSKHGAFKDKEYQNHMPDHWRRAIVENGSGGARFWGYWQLDKAVETVELRRTGRVSTAWQEPVLHHHTPLQRGLGADPLDENGHYVSLPTDPEWDIPRDVAIVMRHLRKLARSRSYVKKVTVERWSVDYETGVVKVRQRKVNRRSHYLRGQRAGFLVVNDGPAAARDIARLLGGATRAQDYELVA